MKSRKFNKEKYAEQKAMKKKNRPQRSYKSLGTTIEIPINHRKHKILLLPDIMTKMVKRTKLLL